MKQVIVQNVPEDLKRNFKKICVINDVSISGVLRDYMREVTTKFSRENKDYEN